MDDFEDFTPSNKGSSTLASIFGKSSSSLDNASLTYTPTKQPKKEANEKKPAKSELRIFKSVHAYKLFNGAYQSLGKMGLAIVGCLSPPVFQLLLYKNNEDVTCRIRIHPNHVLSILDNNYASFYSEDKVNYSVMFENTDDGQSFALHYAIAKSCLSSEIIIQDLLLSNDEVVPSNSEVNVKTTTSKLIKDKESAAVNSDKKGNLSNWDNEPWFQVLKGISYGAKRVIIIPETPDEKLIIQVEVSRLVNQFPSSSEESASFKEKGALIEGAISEKSRKSGILSRVARLGQATLPLKGAVAANLSDTDDDSSPSPKPRIRQKPVMAAAVAPRSIPQLPEVAQPVAVYMPTSNQIMNQAYGQLTPNLLSPDSNFSAHFAESRTNAAEIRMGLSKIADKVDIVINKLHSEPSAVTADAAGILAGVQSLVSENQSLKLKLEEQKMKIDTQSERIYHLLELSHKSLEQNRITQKAPEDENLKRELSDLKEQLEKFKTEANGLKIELDGTKKTIEKLKLDNAELVSKISSCNLIKNELEEAKKELIESQNNFSKLETQKSELLNNLEQVKNLETKNQDLKNELETIKKDNDLKLKKSQEEVSNLLEENAHLKLKAEEKIPQDSNTKVLMNMVYKNLYTKFNPDDQYSGTAIKQVLGSVIKEMTLEFLEKSTSDDQTPDQTLSPNEDPSISQSPSVASPAVVETTTGAQNFSENPNLNKIENSFNQVWQSSEPPPLPTFDEDDENAW